MLKIYYGDMPEAIYNTVVFFKNNYTGDWITDELSKRMIQDVDKSTVLGENVIESPVLGGISPRDLSGGVKTLIEIYKAPDHIFNASACGDNCSKWLLEIGKRIDVTINLRHLMDFGDECFEILVLNTGQIAHNDDELFDIASSIIY